MVYDIKNGMKLRLNRQGIKALNITPSSEILTAKFVVIDSDYKNEYGYAHIESSDKKYVYKGRVNWSEMFDYYGLNVNNEVLDLLGKHDIKSFQAVLDDGRIINFSCLN